MFGAPFLAEKNRCEPRMLSDFIGYALLLLAARREAEEAERAAAAAAQPDLISLDEGDLLGLGDGGGAGSLVLYSGGEATSNDEAIARILQQELNLLVRRGHACCPSTRLHAAVLLESLRFYGCRTGRKVVSRSIMALGAE